MHKLMKQGLAALSHCSMRVYELSEGMYVCADSDTQVCSIHKWKGSYMYAYQNQVWTTLLKSYRMTTDEADRIDAQQER
jgi:hypothetical protein